MKVCPFCGSEDLRIESWLVYPDAPSKHEEYAVVCGNCGAFGPNDLGKSGAEESWNLRRPVAEETKELERQTSRAKKIITAAAYEDYVEEIRHISFSEFMALPRAKEYIEACAKEWEDWFDAGCPGGEK